MRRPPAPSFPVRRAALFSLADARGNNPHGTRETAYDEGRRLNAGRYETIGDLDRALDARARPRLVAPRLGGMQLGASPPVEPAPTGLLGMLALIAVGAGIAYVMMKKGGNEDGEDGEDGVDGDVDFVAAPVPASTTQNVVVQPAPIPIASVPVANPAPAVVSVVASPVKRRARRVRRAKNPVDASVVVPVVTVTSEAVS